MKINPVFINKNVNFTGHEAKKLDALVVQNRRHHPEVIFEQLNNIAMQHKLKVVRAEKEFPTWIQDVLVVTPEKKTFGYLSQSQYLVENCGLKRVEEDNILNYKFNGEIWRGKYFARLLYDYMERHSAFDYIDMITYVPVNDKSMARRGYDQVYEISAEISKISKILLL